MINLFLYILITNKKFSNCQSQCGIIFIWNKNCKSTTTIISIFNELFVIPSLDTKKPLK